jgi:hypothetical protein
MAQGICHACSCVGGAGPACEEAWSPYTQAVFLGKVTSIHSNFWSMLFGNKMPENSVEIEIEEAYLGVSGKTVTVRTAMDGPACGFHFVEGERYLVFASKSTLGFHVSLCSRTRLVKNADEDIAYLRSIPTLQKAALIQGTLWRYTHDPNFKPKFEPSLMDHYRPPEQSYRAMEPVPGANVIVKAKDGEEQKAVVGRDGNWEVAGLRAGEYAIQVPIDDRMYLHRYREKVTIAEKGCAKVDLRIELNGRMTGKLEHPSPTDDWVAIHIVALPEGGSNPRDAVLSVQIRPEESEFTLGPLPEGKYVLGAYVSKQVQVNANAHTYRNTYPTFFPGVNEAGKATVITVGPGQKVIGKDFQLLDLGLVN